MKPLFKISTATAVAVALTTTAHAVLIGVNFDGRKTDNPNQQDPTTYVVTGTAGVVPQANWNNVPGTTSGLITTGTLVDSSGAGTPVTMTYNSNDSWGSDGPVVTQNDILMKGIQKVNGGNGATETFT